MRLYVYGIQDVEKQERTVNDEKEVGEIRRRHVASDSHADSTFLLTSRLYADWRGTR